MGVLNYLNYILFQRGEKPEEAAFSIKVKFPDHKQKTWLGGGTGTKAPREMSLAIEKQLRQNLNASVV